ncbi:MAG: TonB-dependent siderophore receptor [Rhodovulum sulfidophilum]|uniref:TonB-dependent siderophore receptor n=1 Tax=Rhodovulum sulfidophilum TaxID=35806 RepID=A0A2W5N752_RHOSU|nr:MAG: TonB-dependent siderophore receptor [Rhodovulum sulfidophilum]
MGAALGGAIALPAVPSPARAQASGQRTFAIPPGPLGAALTTFGLQAPAQVSYLPETVTGLTTPGVTGSYPPGEALGLLLEGTGLLYDLAPDGSAVVRAPGAGAEPEDGAFMLGTIDVSGASASEGTGSYLSVGLSAVTGLPLTLRETPQSVTVMTQQRIEDLQPDTIRDTITDAVGITTNRQGIGGDSGTAIYSRGFQIENYLVDGIPNGLSTSGATEASPLIYDRVEIVRGSAGMMSGIGSPAATVNMVRKRPTAFPQVIVDAEAGSWSRAGLTADVSGPLNPAGTLRGRIVASDLRQESYVDLYTREDQVIYGVAEFDLTDSTVLTAGASYQKIFEDAPQRTGYPLRFADGSPTDFGRTLNGAPDWTYYQKEATNLFVDVLHEFDNGWTAKAELSHARFQYDAISYYLDGAELQPDGTGATIWPTRWIGDERQTSFDARASGDFTLFGRTHELAFGVSAATQENKSPDYGGWLGPWTGFPGAIDDIFAWRGHGMAEPEFTKVGSSGGEEHSYSAFASTRLSLADPLHLIAGVRVIDWEREAWSTDDASGVTTRSTQKEDLLPVPFLGLTYDVTDRLSVYGSFTRVFAPQQYWAQDVNGDQLDPMRGQSYELGAKMDVTDGLMVTAAVYRTDQDNLAVYNETTQAYEALAGVTTTGGELELTGQITDRWQANAGYAYTISENADGARAVTWIPEHSVKLFTTYAMPGALTGLTLGGGLTWQSETSDDLEGGYPVQPAYTLASLLARYDVNENLRASLRVNNLFDETYYTGISDYGVYGAPRNVVLTLTARF